MFADLFEKFRDMCLKITCTCKISFSFWISMASKFKKIKAKLDLLTVEKCTRGGTCQSIYQYAKSNNK